MLLEGEYLNLVERIMDAMKVTRRDLIKQGAIKVRYFLLTPCPPVVCTITIVSSLN
jgi:hypothetical protein